MEQIPQPGKTYYFFIVTGRIYIYNGEKPILDKENQPPTGFRDPIEPADETVESMAEAAAVSHTHDEEDNDDDDDATSVSPSLVSTAATGTGKKKNRKKKPKSKRGLVGTSSSPSFTTYSLKPSGRANGFRRILRRRSFDTCPTRRKSGAL